MGTGSAARAKVALLAACILAGSVMALASSAHAAPEDMRLPGGPTSATDSAPVELDSRLYLPESLPAPAVILAHGFGGSKESVQTQAEELTGRGFVVLT